MKQLNVLIVEDEVLIAETIKIYLEERGHKVVDMAISYDEAVAKIQVSELDIILLDIRLYGDKSGLDVAQYILDLEIPVPYVIVSSQYDTAYIEKAMQAQASGYITKPISKETLWSTIELSALKSDQQDDSESYIDLKISHGIQRVRVNDILYIKSDHVYVEVVCKNAKYFCRYSLAELLRMINQPHIIQCHRSYIVNTKMIERLDSSRLFMDNVEIPISNKYKKEVGELF